MNGQNELQVFDFGGHQTRIIMKDGEPWWVAKDVCEILELSNPSEAIKPLDDDEKLALSFSEAKSLGFDHATAGVNTINEPGLFKLILRSNKTEAKIFQRFVTHEVLPALRKTGEYATPSKQREKAKEHDELAAKRLEIMEKNANWRMAKLILEGIDKFREVMTPESKTVFMAKYAELTAGGNMTHMLPAASGKWHSATEIGATCGVSSAKIGRIANLNCLKAPDGESNEYGTWIRSKSRNSSREVMTWVYSEKAFEWFRQFFGVKKTA